MNPNSIRASLVCQYLKDSHQWMRVEEIAVVLQLSTREALPFLYELVRLRQLSYFQGYSGKKFGYCSELRNIQIAGRGR